MNNKKEVIRNVFNAAITTRRPNVAINIISAIEEDRECTNEEVLLVQLLSEAISVIATQDHTIQQVRHRFVDAMSDHIKGMDGMLTEAMEVLDSIDKKE